MSPTAPTNDADEATPSAIGFDLVQAVIRLRTALRTQIRRAASNAPLEEAERDLLLVVSEHGGMSLSEAARRSTLSITVAKRAADGLSKRGLVVRRSDPADPSGIGLSATPAAEDRLSEGWALGGRIMAQGLQELDDQDRAVIPAAIPALHHLTQQLEGDNAPEKSLGSAAAVSTPIGSAADARLEAIATKVAETMRNDDPTEVLAAVGELVHDLRGLEHEQVQNLRSLGYSWQKIADALGMSKQAAHARFADST
jgi:DNA-binding MarR family transcriptional regulator